MHPPSGSPSPQTLADMSSGQRARVVEVHGRGGMALRLLEMGFVPGASCELIKRAPMGDPIELRLRGYNLSLRKTEASMIQVHLEIS